MVTTMDESILVASCCATSSLFMNILMQRSFSHCMYLAITQKSAFYGSLINLLDEVTHKHDENAVVSNIVYGARYWKGLIMCKL